MKNLKIKTNLRKVAIIFACLAVTAAVCTTWAQTPATTTIKFDGGSLQATGFGKTPIVPDGMTENDRSYILHIKYTLNSNADSEAERNKFTTMLRDEGQFVAPNGKIYKSGMSLVHKQEPVCMLIVAVPNSLDANSLKFSFKGMTIELKDVKKL